MLDITSSIPAIARAVPDCIVDAEAEPLGLMRSSVMVRRPADFNAFEFVVMSSQRAAQLTRGCIPLVARDDHKFVTTAQMEVASYKIIRSAEPPPVAVLVEAPILVAVGAE